MCRVRLPSISRSLDALACLQQVRGHVGPAHLDAKTFDEASARYDRTAGLPERAPSSGAGLDDTSSQVERAHWPTVVHEASFGRGGPFDISDAPTIRAGFY